MTLLIEETSKLTGKNQTTVPKSVRQSLGLRPGDQIAYRVDDRGHVSLSRLDDDEAAVDVFLDFLSNDIKRNPESVTPMNTQAVRHAHGLVAGMDIDLDDDLPDATSI